MARANSHEHWLAPQGNEVRCMPQWRPVPVKLVVRDGKNELARAGTCTTRTRWSCDERVSSGQRLDLRVCYLREQDLGIWEYYIQQQQAVAKRGREEEMLSGREQGRYWIISNRIDERRYEKEEVSKSCSKWNSENLKMKDIVRELIEQINLYVKLGLSLFTKFTAVEVIRPLYVKIFDLIWASLIQFISISMYSYLQPLIHNTVL